eukprot:gb/GECH01007751.1/.p1 GENE.gb/GECH01007751.1/~~gb/GECH01007751.1/.p1  ORF type:complete len:429 (+),score=90.87 gb/GECH01007751.1/:1-1287(+)
MKTNPIEHICTIAIEANCPSEDRYLIDKFKDTSQFFGVFDGHGGGGCSQYVKDHLSKQVEEKHSSLQKSNLSHREFTEKMKQHFKDAFEKTDQSFAAHVRATRMKNVDIAGCGSCGVAGLLDASGRGFFVANAGDSKAVLGRSQSSRRSAIGEGFASLTLTATHNTTNPDERDAVQKRSSDPYAVRPSGASGFGHLLSVDTTNNNNNPNNDRKITINDFPSEIFMIICSFMDFTQLHRCCSVCIQWYHQCANDSIWKIALHHFLSSQFHSPTSRNQDTIQTTEIESILSSNSSYSPRRNMISYQYPLRPRILRWFSSSITRSLVPSSYGGSLCFRRYKHEYPKIYQYFECSAECDMNMKEGIYLGIQQAHTHDLSAWLETLTEEASLIAQQLFNFFLSVFCCPLFWSKRNFGAKQANFASTPNLNRKP